MNFVDIGLRLQGQLISAELTVQVINILRHNLRGLPAADTSAVGQVAAQAQADTGCRQQGAAAVRVVRFYHGINLRHQYLLRAAVGQPYGLRHHPDDIAGQQAHLLRRQRHAGHQIVRFAKGDAVIHQHFVLLFYLPAGATVDYGVYPGDRHAAEAAVQDPGRHG